jgi:hypothetical protein
MIRKGKISNRMNCKGAVLAHKVTDMLLNPYSMWLIISVIFLTSLVKEHWWPLASSIRPLFSILSTIFLQINCSMFSKSDSLCSQDSFRNQNIRSSCNKKVKASINYTKWLISSRFKIKVVYSKCKHQLVTQWLMLGPKTQIWCLKTFRTNV